MHAESGRSQPENESGEEPRPGTLFVVATPIGNLNDVTLRALEVLAQVTRIAAEDTRQVRKLLDRHGIPPPILEPYHAHNEARMAGRLSARLQSGESMAVLTDAGTPGISDPGFTLIRAVLKIGGSVVSIPGPSAVLAALLCSGLPTDRFLFEGFPPRQSGPRRRALGRLMELPHTLVFFEAPPRLRAFLADVLEVLGDRPLAIGRELTKLHEDVWRGKVAEYLGRSETAIPKGEVTVVIGGRTRAAARAARRSRKASPD